MNVIHAQVFEDPQFLHDVFWRTYACGVLIADMLDTVRAAGWTAATGDDEGEWPFDHGHAILLQW